MSKGKSMPQKTATPKPREYQHEHAWMLEYAAWQNFMGDYKGADKTMFRLITKTVVQEPEDGEEKSKNS